MRTRLWSSEKKIVYPEFHIRNELLKVFGYIEHTFIDKISFYVRTCASFSQRRYQFHSLHLKIFLL